MTQDYASRLRIPLGRSEMLLRTPQGFAFAEGYERVVIGGRGPYVEFFRHQIKMALHEVATPHYYFVERRTNCGIKVYDQLHPVDYADYQSGMLYVSPFDLRDGQGRELIVPRENPCKQGRLF